MLRRTFLSLLLAAPAVAELRAPKTRLPALFRAYPSLAEHVPWLSLGGLPTPVVELPELGRELGFASLAIKRDDLAGVDYGGSKLRKLEFLLGDAESRHAREIVASGGVASNQTLATALFARRRGLGVRLHLLPERPSPAARSHILAQARLGAEQRLVGSEAESNRKATKLAGAYVIPTGGSSTVGNLGFVEAGFELARQISEGRASAPSVVYLPLGTGGSAVGLRLGFDASKVAARVVAVRTASPRYGTKPQLASAYRGLARYLEERAPGFPSRSKLDGIDVREGFVGKGYAEPTAGGRRARERLARAAKLELDLTYSAKAFAALLADAPRLVGERVLFWLTFDARPVPLPDGPGTPVPKALAGYLRG